MNNKMRFLVGGLAILMVVALFPVLLQGTNQKSESQPLSGWADNSQPQSDLVAQQMGQMPLAFTENRGQWHEQALFKANAGGATMWFTSEGTYYQFTRRIPRLESSTEDSGAPHPDGRRQLAVGLPDRGRLDHEPDSTETMAIKTSFIGANPNPEIIGEGLMEYKCNYFIGNDPAEWHTDVPNYRAVCLKEVYSGIDLRYYGNGKKLEYDFIVSPGADPAKIAIRYEGALSLSVNSTGELVVETEWGEVIEQRPVVYQMQNGVRKSIEGEYLLAGDNSFGFSLGNDYDPALPLVIDPVLTYSTYLGGSGYEESYDIAVDGSGNAYITGVTASSDFPTEGEYQTYQGGGDVFVTKLNSPGNALVYSTYLGGSSGDEGRGIVVDDFGNAYIAGYTMSSDFPTEGAYQADYGGGHNDAFVTKLNSFGNDLVYSTYLGGSESDVPRGISVDGSGSAYITGYTQSDDFPTENPFQVDPGGGINDAFVTKLNSFGNALVYSTYLGGSDFDFGWGISVDGFGSAYITGGTYSTDFPIEGEYQTYHGGGCDVFVTKLNGAGNDLVYSTYLGGSEGDVPRGISVDGSGSAYITGYTQSDDFPTENPFQVDHGGGYEDAFMTKLSSSGNDLVYSTFLGGSNGDEGWDIAVDGSGNAHITGRTWSSDFPTEGEYQTYQGSGDAFVTKLNSSGNALVYSTYLGGSDWEYGNGMAVDGSGNAYISGRTFSSDFPTEGEYQTHQGGYDAFVTKLSSCDCGTKGDVNNDASTDPLDVTYLVNYVYLSQDALAERPNCPYPKGDMNCDESADPLDVTYLVNYVYLSQDALCDGCSE